MNTTFFYPFLSIVILVIASVLFLPLWIKGRLPKYLQSRDPNSVYAVILVVFGLLLGVIPLLGWVVSFLGLLKTTTDFDPTGNQLHDWAFTLYGYLFSFRWPFMVTVLLLFSAGIYFWMAGRKK